MAPDRDEPPGEGVAVWGALSDDERVVAVVQRTPPSGTLAGAWTEAAQALLRLAGDPIVSGHLVFRDGARVLVRRPGHANRSKARTAPRPGKVHPVIRTAIGLPPPGDGPEDALHWAATHDGGVRELVRCSPPDGVASAVWRRTAHELLRIAGGDALVGSLVREDGRFAFVRTVVATPVRAGSVERFEIDRRVDQLLGEG